MQNIEDWKFVASNMPVQFLYVLFPANSILRLGYTNSDCKEEGFSYYGTQSIRKLCFDSLSKSRRYKSAFDKSS